MEPTLTKMGHDTCPTCGYMCDAATNLEDDKKVPTPGDISCCINCGGILEYSSDMALQQCSADHFLNFEANSIHAILQARSLIKKRGPIL